MVAEAQPRMNRVCRMEPLLAELTSVEHDRVRFDVCEPPVRCPLFRTVTVMAPDERPENRPILAHSPWHLGCSNLRCQRLRIRTCDESSFRRPRRADS